MLSFIPEEEIRKDIKIIKEAPDIKVKREIGEKYGCPRNQCSKWTAIYLYILEYLREIRKIKSSFSEDDIHDFYTLTNYVSKYEKLKPYLMMETGTFIKYILDNEYQFLLKKGVKQYTLDNIDKVTINDNITYGSTQLKFYLDRYKSIKKYYDENHGEKREITKEQNDRSTNLYIELVELTYDIRMELEQHLEDFILECYDIYKYGSSEYVKIHNLLTKYRKIINEKNPDYDPDHKPDEEEIKLINYCNSLHLLLRAYQYFNEEENEWGYRNRATREDRIENSIQYFNKIFEKTLNGIVKRLQGIDLSDIEISQELNATDFGYYFLIKYGSKNLYVNFILQHENQDYEDIEKFSKNKQHISFLNNLVVAYEMKVTSKPLKQINESFNDFDFNIL